MSVQHTVRTRVRLHTMKLFVVYVTFMLGAFSVRQRQRQRPPGNPALAVYTHHLLFILECIATVNQTVKDSV